LAGVRSIIYIEDGELKLQLTNNDYNEIVQLARDYHQSPYKSIDILKSEIEAQVEYKSIAEELDQYQLDQYYQIESRFKEGICKALNRQ
jgi:hypothetical protein